MDDYLLGRSSRNRGLILIDEAHRSQCGILGATLNRVLPGAVKIAFTGTPVLRYERNTLQYFSYPEETSCI